jgi:inosine-uridine nucleoside N-ribohydrolase
MEKVLLDTDIGTDVDDAVALAYLLAQPECELLGITTVTGEAARRAALASVVCLAAGRGDIPIYPGEEAPLMVPQRQLQAQQAAALPRWPHREDYPQGQAVEFMRRTIRAHPGEVTLCAVGPLTNLAILFRQDPEIPTLLKGLATMGGIFAPGPVEEEKTEWNAAGDPQATEIVYQARPRLHRSFGIDVTQQVMLTAEEVRRKFTAPLLRPVLDFAEIWFAGFYPSITFHDPLTAAAIFDPGLCTYRQGKVTIDLDRHPGRTVFHPGGPGSPHQVAASVDRERYFVHFFGVFV